MAKTEKTEKTSKKRGDDLADMREAYKNQKERRGGGGGSGKEDWDKLGAGKNMRRFLPRKDRKDRKFYTEGWTHFNVGPNERAVRCVDEDKIDVKRGLPIAGTKCPLCKKFLREQARVNSEFPKGDEEGRAEWKRAKDKYVPRHQHYANVLREDDEGDFEVKILSFGPQIWEALMNYYLGDDTEIGDFTDPESGRWMNIKKESKGGRDRRNVGYAVFPATEVADISDAWEAIEDQLHDLDAACGKLLSVDEVVAIMKGEDVSKGDSDDDDSDDDDDDKDDGKEESEEEEEEEEKPKKGGKLAGKMGKKKRDD